MKCKAAYIRNYQYSGRRKANKSQIKRCGFKIQNNLRDLKACVAH